MTSGFRKCVMLSRGDRTIWISINPRSEFNGEFINAPIEKRRRGIIPDELLDRALNEITRHTSSNELGDLIAQFSMRRFPGMR